MHLWQRGEWRLSERRNPVGCVQHVLRSRKVSDFRLLVSTLQTLQLHGASAGVIHEQIRRAALLELQFRT